ncbi:MAG: tRNA (adenosine(37)-N6)-threonylcarbamoyltransferase complex transferase subunit TsaD [Patescibacteria group bacterium]
MRILGIETSCDETSVAILDVRGTSVRRMFHETASQIPVHAVYGGVVPEVAARLHVAEIVALLDRSIFFRRGGVTPSGRGNRAPTLTHATDLPFDVIAVAKGPGLATALRVGVEAARTLAFATGKPIVGVNHLEGHLASAWLAPENRRRWEFPVMALLVSGGHSEIVLMKDFGSYQVLGRTRDDAAGEAFDKTAKLMGLGYPGGPAIAKAAEGGNPKAFELPRPMLHDGSFDMSFSGLKSAVARTWDEVGRGGVTPPGRGNRAPTKKTVSDMCASVQEAIVDVLVAKTIAAAKAHRPKALCIVGGVSANAHLQERMKHAVRSNFPLTKGEYKGVRMLAPARGFHTDNAAMIAAAGAWHLLKGESHDWKKMDAEPEMDL